MTYRTVHEERVVTATKIVEVEVTTCDACGKEVETIGDEGKGHRSKLIEWLHTATFTNISGYPGESNHYCPACRKKIDVTIQAIKEEK